METTTIGDVGDKFIEYIKTKKIDVNNKKKLGKIKIKLNNLGNDRLTYRMFNSMLEHLEFSDMDIEKINKAWFDFVSKFSHEQMGNI